MTERWLEVLAARGRGRGGSLSADEFARGLPDSVYDEPDVRDAMDRLEGLGVRVRPEQDDPASSVTFRMTRSLDDDGVVRCHVCIFRDSLVGHGDTPGAALEDLGRACREALERLERHSDSFERLVRAGIVREAIRVLDGEKEEGEGT